MGRVVSGVEFGVWGVGLRVEGVGLRTRMGTWFCVIKSVEPKWHI